MSKIEELQNNLSLYDQQIQRHPKRSNNYYLKAEAFLDLANEVEQDRSKYLNEALSAYNKAIELDPTKVLYLTGRSKLYVQLGRTSLALEDLRKISTLPEDSGVIGLYVRDTLEDISKLIQNQVAELVKEGKISEEEAILSYSLKSTTSLAVENAYYPEKGETKEDLRELLKNQITKAIKLEYMIKEIQSGQKIQVEQLASVVEWQGETKKKLEAIENALKVFDQTILELKKKVEANELIKAEDKEAIHQRIDSIMRMTSKFADKEDVKKITVSVTKLVVSDQMTKEALLDLEIETEKLAQRQEESEQRINILEKSQQQFSEKIVELKNKISTDSKITQQDKKAMIQYIEDIREKMNSVVKLSDIEAITTKMNIMITQKNISKDRLSAIEQEIDHILEKQNNFSEEIVSLQQRNEELSAESASLKSRVEKTEAELNNKLDDHLKKLNKELDSSSFSESDKAKVSDYYKAFISTFSSVYVTAQAIDSGQLTLKTTNMETIGLATLASFLPLIGDQVSSAITSANDFLVSNEMKTNARKLKELAGDNSELSQLVGNSAFQITSNKNKQHQIVTTTDEVIGKEAASWYEKFIALCQKLSIEIDNKLYTEKYPTAAAKLGNKDANLLIGKLIQGEIQVGANSENKIEQFTNKIILSSASLDSLSDNISRVQYLIPPEVTNQVQTNSANGLWDKKWSSVNLLTSSTKEILSDEYLESEVRLTKGDLDYARIVLFKHICLGIKNRNNENMECVREFSNSYPKLIQIITEKFSDYFVDDEEIADTCAAISKAKLVEKVVNESYSITESKDEIDVIVNAVTDIMYDNELLNYPELLKEPLKIFSLNQILDLSERLNQALITEAVTNNDSCLVLGGLMSLSGEDSYN